MDFSKSPPELIEAFEALKPGPPAQSRKMFGYPACFVGGNMFMSLFRDRMVLRLPEEARGELVKLGAGAFEPMPGRVMRDYVALPLALVARRTVVAPWVAKSLAYASLLAPKKPKSKTAGPAKPRARRRG